MYTYLLLIISKAAKASFFIAYHKTLSFYCFSAPVFLLTSISKYIETFCGFIGTVTSNVGVKAFVVFETAPIDNTK